MSEVLASVESLYRGISGKPVSPALAERVNIVHSALSGLPAPRVRTVAAPVYVTDLGVRYFPDPLKFYKAHVEIAGSKTVAEDALVKAVSASSDDALASVVDSLVMFFGNYHAVVKGFKGRSENASLIHNYETLIILGSVYSAVADESATVTFERAENAASGSSQAYGAVHRKAAFYLKRLGNPDLAQRELQRGYDLYLNSDAGSILDLALFYNLQALIEVKMHSGNESIVLHKALDSLSRFDLSEVCVDVASRAGRYRSQILINKAQLLTRLGQFEDASAVLRDNLEQTHNVAYDYYPEALAEYVLMRYISGDYKEVCKLAPIAVGYMASIGAIGSVARLREVMVAALHKMRRDKEANLVLELRRSDVLGIKHIGEF
jgi:hypothetical protein